jgi:hypothetical protein
VDARERAVQDLGGLRQVAPQEVRAPEDRTRPRRLARPAAAFGGGDGLREEPRRGVVVGAVGQGHPADAEHGSELVVAHGERGGSVQPAPGGGPPAGLHVDVPEFAAGFE